MDVFEEDFEVIAPGDPIAAGDADSQPKNVLTTITKWLSPTDYSGRSSEYARHLASKSPQTGLWLLNTQQFKAWHDSQTCGAIWIKAVAGAGKSVLAASMIDRLARTEACPVAYFFFRHIVESNKGPGALVRDFLAQLLPYSPQLQASLRVHADAKREFGTLKLATLWRYVLLGLSNTSRSYLIIDGLDEMQAQDTEFLYMLNDLATFRPASVKLMLTSRPRQDLQTILRDPSVVHVSLEADLVQKDISQFVCNELRKLPLTEDISSALLESIMEKADGLFLFARLAIDQLCRHFSAGAEQFVDPQKLVSKLPLGLEDMYYQLLSEYSVISGASQSQQILVLGLVTHASRPLRLLELAEVLRMQDSAVKDAGKARALVRNCCGPLLEILEDETVQIFHHSVTEFLTNTERAHAVTSECLPFPVLQPTQVHNDIARYCLEHLSSGTLGPPEAHFIALPPKDWNVRRALLADGSEDETPLFECGGRLYYVEKGSTAKVEFRDKDRRTSRADNDSSNVTFDYSSLRLKYPFLGYAIESWLYHVKFSDSKMDASVLCELNSFLRPFGVAFYCWLSASNAIENIENKNGLSQIFPYSETGYSVYGRDIYHSKLIYTRPIHLAASNGLLEYAASLINAQSDVDCRNAVARTPLHLAAQSGHTSLVKMLLGHGADIGSIDSYHLKPIHLAAIRDNFKVVDILMQAGASPMDEVDPERRLYRGHFRAPRKYAITALRCAIDANSLDSIKVMLPQVSGSDANEALCLAASRGNHRILQEILSITKISPNQLNSEKKSALFNAARCHSLESVKVLLAASADVGVFSCYDDADIDVHSMIGRKRTSYPDQLTPIHGFANPQTAVHQLKPEESRTILSILLDSGSLIDSIDSDGRTPLMASLQCIERHSPCGDIQGSELILDLLLEAGADPNLETPKGRTMLHVLCKREKYANLVRLLLNRGVDVNARSKIDGKTPLHLAAEHMSADGAEYARLLAGCGACIDIMDNDGNTPLHLAIGVYTVRIETVKILLDRGADVNARNNAGLTPLHVLTNQDTEPGVAELLLEKGGNLEARDDQGRSPLLYAIHSGRPHIADRWLRLGAAFTSGSRGKSAPHLACEVQSLVIQETFDVLIQHGAKCDDIDHEGNSVLHEAAKFYNQHCNENLIKRLLDMGLSALDRNCDGRTPLHLAMMMSPTAQFWYQKDSLPLSRFINILVNSGKGSPIDVADEEGKTPLFYAAATSQFNVHFLLQANASIHKRAKDECTVLHAAAKGRQPDSMAILLKLVEPDFVNIQDRSGQTALHVACQAGSRELVHLLLLHGARFDIVDNSGRTALDACADFAGSQRSSIARPTAGSDANIDSGGSEVFDAEADASLVPHSANEALLRREDSQEDYPHISGVIEELVTKGASFSRPSKDILSPFKAARVTVKSGMISSLIHFSKRGLIPPVASDVTDEPDVDFCYGTTKAASTANLKTRSGHHDVASKQLIYDYRYAAHFLHDLETFGEFVEKGPSFTDLGNEASEFGVSAIHHFAFSGLLEFLRMVPDSQLYEVCSIEWLNKKQKRDKHYWNHAHPTVLYSACKRQTWNLHTVRHLIEERQLDINGLLYEPACLQQDGNSWELRMKECVLHDLARGQSSWHLDAIKYLLSKGANVDCRDHNGRTPLMVACAPENGRSCNYALQLDTVRILIEAGADINATNKSGFSCVKIAADNKTILTELLGSGTLLADDAAFLLERALFSTDTEVIERFLNANYDPNMILPGFPHKQECDSRSLEGSFINRVRQHRCIPLLYMLVLSEEKYRRNSSTIEHIIETLLGHGADIYADIGGNQKLLHFAFAGCSTNVLAIFVRQRAFDLMALNQQGIAVFISAFQNYREHKFFKRTYDRAYFILNSPDLMRTVDWAWEDPAGRTILHFASTALFQSLLALEPVRSIVNKKDNLSISPLFRAATSSEISVLLQHGADVLARNANGDTVLHKLKHAPDPLKSQESQDQRWSTRGSTYSSFHHVRNPRHDRSKAIAEVLSELPPILHVPLPYVLEEPQQQLWDAYLERGGTIDDVNNDGESALFEYLRSVEPLPGWSPQPDVASVVTPFDRADHAIVNSSGQSILHVLAARKMSEDSLSRPEDLLLLRQMADLFAHYVAKGLDPLAQDNEHRSPLDIAAATGNSLILDLFARTKR